MQPLKLDPQLRSWGCSFVELLLRSVKFDQTLSEPGLPQLGLRPYSLRRGGATLAFRWGVPLSKLCVRGRLSQEKTARIYMQEAVSLFNAMSMSPAVILQLGQLADAWGFDYLR